jgi:hypothetical protein
VLEVRAPTAFEMSSYLVHAEKDGTTVSPLVASSHTPDDEETEDGAVMVVDQDSLAAFYAEVDPGSKSMIVAINMSNAIIGAGIIGIPYAFTRSGFGFGLCLLGAMAGVSLFSVSSLVGSGIALRARSYEETARIALGPNGERAVLAGQFGKCGVC